MKLTVYDRRTNEYPTEEVIQEYAKANDLIYCDIEGFALTEDMQLILCDECGNWCYADLSLFGWEIRIDNLQRMEGAVVQSQIRDTTFAENIEEQQ